MLYGCARLSAHHPGERWLLGWSMSFADYMEQVGGLAACAKGMGCWVGWVDGYRCQVLIHGVVWICILACCAMLWMYASGQDLSMHCTRICVTL